MLKSSLLEILRTFNSEELKKFEDFIDSPYFNKKVNALKLFSEVKKYFPEFKDENLNRKTIWEKIFPEKDFNYGVMKNVIFDLHRLSENFLQLLHFEQNKINKANMLLSEYLFRSLNKQFEKEAKLVRNLLNNSKHDLTYYLDKLNFEAQNQNYFHSKKINIDRHQDADEYNLSLLKFCFANFFDRNYSNTYTSDKLKKKIHTDLIGTVTEFFEKSPLINDDESLIFYHSIILAIKSDDRELFYKLKSLIDKNYFRFSKKQQYDFYIRLVNFCLPRFNIDPELSKMMFEIFKSMLEKKLFTDVESKYLHYFTYIGIAESALFCKEYEWARNFIEDYKDKLDPEFRGVYYEKALVSYYYVTKDFVKALEILSKIKITAHSDKLSIKKFQFMFYYELDYIDELILLIDSSRHYISIDKNLSDIIKNNFLDFTQVMRKLITIKTAIGFDKNITYQIETLKKEILSKDIYNKIWVNEKIKELETRVNII